MDKGAHFYKCDFQVHTPRDIRWQGQSAVTDAERRAYADELVLACRSKGINAIAITDHHDLVFYPYVKEAAKNERDDKGEYYPPKKQLIVYPGIELTFSNPASCQAILILDADFPTDQFSRILNKLALNPNDVTEEHTAEVTPISADVVQDLSDLHKKLDSVEGLKSRYIILPNVSNGHGSVLRRGFYEHYQKMPCVGGYVDGEMPTGEGFSNIINGKDRNYGFKKIAVFQTSDNRKRDHADLGRATTWVKWAAPTAEALRQASLARESRISQSDPSLPNIHITSIDVSNSKFLGMVYLEFNRQYNALIGGRGTGKSSVLEYLRWGLCDQPPESKKIEILPEHQARRKKLIENTLMPFEATVQITFIKNGVTHIIKRKSDTNEIFMKIGDGDFSICKEIDVRNILPIQAYSQKQLSSVGVSIEELRRLIYSPIRQELNVLKTKFKELASEIRNSYEQIVSKKNLTADIKKDELELKSLNEQLTKLKGSLKGLSPKDKALIEAHASYETTQEQIDSWVREIVNTRKDIDELAQKLENYPSDFDELPSLVQTDKDLIEKARTQIGELFKSVKSNVRNIKDQVAKDSSSTDGLRESIVAWKSIYEAHNQAYEEAKARTSSHEKTLQQIKSIENKVKEIRKAISEKQDLIKRKGTPEETFETLKKEWIKLHSEKGSKIEKQCNLVTEYSKDALRALLGRGKGTDELSEKLKELLQGTKVHRSKVDDLCEKLTKAEDSIKEFEVILAELQSLSDIESEDDIASLVPETPLLSSIGFTQNDLVRLAEKLTPEDWIDIFLIELKDVPLFEYKTKDGEYIDFSDASAGQQATVLMSILLSQEGPPLIIDQPEDDLDNEMVSKIAEFIWESKSRRQIIFASHNANIVVNGDAELVACCKYRIAADQSKGIIDKEGAIDIPEIREEITRIMEGGERAFKLRKEKYGY